MGPTSPPNDTAALSEQLTAVSSRAISQFQAAGEEIDGGPAQTQATPIEPGVAYVDDILKGEARWYSIELTEGQQVTITATDDGSADYGCCINYELLESERRRGSPTTRATTSRATANTYVLAASRKSPAGSTSPGPTTSR